LDLRYSESDEKFRAELRAWLEEAVPAHGDSPPRHAWDERRAWDTGWQRKLFDAGYAGINWPREYGGRDASPTEQLVYYEEIARAKAPYVGVNFVGLLHGGPTLIVEGSDEQKTRHLPYIPRRRPLRGERPQGLDELCPGGRLLRAAGAHRPRRAQAQGDQLVGDADGPAGHHDPADPHIGRRG
jgi:hypothetical protein